MEGPPLLLSLDDPRSTDPALTGAKAANLARCAGLATPVLPGFVLTTVGVEQWSQDRQVAGLRDRWAALAGEVIPLVVRSSSTVEDAGTSSMAGQFTSVLDVAGWDAFVDAVDRVVASAARVADAESTQPIAVLVQRQLDARIGGVMFGVDPVTGERHHVVVEVVPSRPDTLVGGTATAGHLVLTRRGRVVSKSGGPGAEKVDAALRRRLVRLARQASHRFGTPQDIEWAVDPDGRLWLLQSRPVTAVADSMDRHRVVLGSGPVAETFPDPLSSLEQDLFLPPLREGIVGALQLTGVCSEQRLERSPVLVAVSGRVAVDLALLGVVGGELPWWERIKPSYIVRHVAVAWRVGRARVALPELGSHVLEQVDQHLVDLPRLDGPSSAELVELVERSRRELATVHRLEVLAGMLLRDETHTPPTGAIALTALSHGRRDGLSDEDIIVECPVVLALSAPAIRSGTTLPDQTGARLLDPLPGVEDLGLRDGLRLRTRWLQELLARVAVELGRRLADEGRLVSPADVRWLSWQELAAMVGGAAGPSDLYERSSGTFGAPLPSAFWLADDGTVRTEPGHLGGGATTAGIPAGGGRVAGVVRHRVPPGAAGEHARDERATGSVLVVRHLAPDLAPLLGDIDGLVSETGSALSHLAILARESGVATVVGVEGALHRFPVGTQLLVDGTTGDVRAIGERAA